MATSSTTARSYQYVIQRLKEKHDNKMVCTVMRELIKTDVTFRLLTKSRCSINSQSTLFPSASNGDNSAVVLECNPMVSESSGLDGVAPTAA
jgi:hypothetical protein